MVSETARAEIGSLLVSNTLPPTDLFAPAVKDVLSTLQVAAVHLWPPRASGGHAFASLSPLACSEQLAFHLQK